MDDNILDFTGERYLPSVGGSIELEHMHRYLVAKDYVAGMFVLDIACGEGYGSKCLSESADSVVGVDVNEEIIEHANNKYGSNNLKYLNGSCESIPLDSGVVDVVVSFETIEHHDRHDEMMLEIKRVLKPGGLLIISSPDKLEYSDLTGYKNPYHVKELYRDEFEGLLSRYFANIKVQGQRVVYGSLIQSQCDSVGLTTYHQEQFDVKQQLGIRKAIYLVAVASDSEISPVRSSIYEKPIYMSEVVQDLYHELAETKERAEQSSIQVAYLEQAKPELVKQSDELKILQQEIRELSESKERLLDQLHAEQEKLNMNAEKIKEMAEQNAWLTADRQRILNSLPFKIMKVFGRKR